MKTYKKIVLAVMLALVLSATVQAQQPATSSSELLFSFWKGDERKLLNFGDSKKEAYDAAIRIADSRLVGKTITRLILPINTVDAENCSAWLSTELKLETVDGVKTNVPDVCSVPFSAEETGWLELPLPKPYTITEKGVYVGVSFTITQSGAANNKPLLCTNDVNADGMYIHTGKVYLNWQSISQTAGMSLAMGVVLSGDDIEPHSLRPIVDNVVYGPKVGVSTTYVALSNIGYAAVESLDYEYTVGTDKGSGHIDLAEPIPARYDARSEFLLEFPSQNSDVEVPLNFSITKVNGQPNTGAETACTSMVHPLNTFAKHRPLVEEYTGMWCVSCPTGFVSMEHLRELYPDDFVIVCYHYKDSMWLGKELPLNTNGLGFPHAEVDRKEAFSVFAGYNLDLRWGADEPCKKHGRIMAPADIDVKASWADSEASAIDVEATVTFSFDTPEHNYKLGYVLLADSLRSDYWYQANGFNVSGSNYGELMAPFTGTGDYVFGLTFNQVPIGFSDVKGDAGVFPAQIAADEPYRSSYRFSLADAVNTEGVSLVQNREYLRVAVYLLDGDVVVNANQFKVPAMPGTGVGRVLANDSADSEPAEYFTLQGVKVDRPSSAGVYIVRRGNKTEKVLIR